MLLNFHSPRHIAARFSLTVLTIAGVLVFSTPIYAQTTVANGSIQGTVTDPSGAVVSGATVTVTNKSMGQLVTTTTSGSGTYSSGALLPGDYLVRVEAK